MPKMDDERLVALVEGEFSTAQGGPGGEISNERAKAYDYYLSKPYGDEEDGSSTVVTSDVADVIDGIIPSLLRIFTTADNLVDFDPVDKDDIPGAEQESDYVNYVFFKRNNAFLIMLIWFMDALVQKNGIVKAWWDDSDEFTTETYTRLNDFDLQDLLEDDELEIEEQEETEEQGLTLHNVTFKRTRKPYARVENVPPEEYRVSSDSRSLDPSDAKMVGQERELTRSDLIGMGFSASIVNELPTVGDEISSSEEEARKDKSDDQNDSAASPDTSQDKILVKEAYMRVDFDGDGRSELRQITIAGGKILLNEETDRQPFHVISPQPLPHKHFGRATAEKVMDVQRINSTLVRQGLNNVYQTNNPGHAVWEQGMSENTLPDLLTRRVGAVTRFKRPPQESWMPMAVPFTAGAIFPFIEYWEKVKRDRTGISSDSEGLSPEDLKHIQQSVMASANDLSRMKIEAIVRIFMETGVKSLFLHLHELLQKNQDKEEIVRLRNEFVQVSPSEWRTRRNMTVKIGLGIGTRDQNLIHLNAIFEKQAAMVSAGGLGVTVTPRNIFNTAAEIVKNANLKDPNMFFTDPGDGEIPQQQDEAGMLQLQIAMRQQELDAAKQQLDTQRAMAEHQRKMAELELKNQEREDKLFLGMEDIKTKLTALEVEFNKDIPGSKV